MKKVVLSSLLLLALQPVAFAADNTAEKPAMQLPPAQRVDKNADMEKSMKKMGKNFKKLRKADDLADMKKPVEELAIYASQSQAIAEEMAQGMKKLRMGIAQLQAAIDSGDVEGAKKILKVMNEKRKDAHEYFGVDDD